MRARCCEAGFTLIELLVVTAIVATIALAAGTFFLAGATPAVASAGRDVNAAFAEARRTALAFDVATVVFVPGRSGGYSARVYQRFPGDAGFAPRNGPTYDSTVTIGETAAPLGAPGFAFAIDSRGTVTGYANFSPTAAAFATRACPAGGAFVLRLSYATQVQTVTVPCALTPSGASPVAFETPAAPATAAPLAAPTCPGPSACSLADVPPPPAAACPAGDVPDPASPGLCDPSSLPPGSGGAPATAPAALPTSANPNPPVAGCGAGPADTLGFASCIVSNPVRITGPSITVQSCGTHTPVTDPGQAFGVTVDVFRDGDLWGTYAIHFITLKFPWIALNRNGVQQCGLLYTLSFIISGIVAESGNAAVSPWVDTGDPLLAQQGVGAITHAPLGAGWGSNS
jgi:prepilin-type N-terminal cleavage/methylation domain-containing protein